MPSRMPTYLLITIQSWPVNPFLPECCYCFWKFYNGNDPEMQYNQAKIPCRFTTLLPTWHIMCKDPMWNLSPVVTYALKDNIFYRHEKVLVCELICMITGVLFIHASDCTCFFIYHITLHSHQINWDVSRFVLLCSLHNSVWCGLWLDMCDIWPVVYARQTYQISIFVISGLLFMSARHTKFHFICLRLHNIPLIALRCTKRKQIPAQLFHS